MAWRGVAWCGRDDSRCEPIRTTRLSIVRTAAAAAAAAAAAWRSRSCGILEEPHLRWQAVIAAAARPAPPRFTSLRTSVSAADKLLTASFAGVTFVTSLGSGSSSWNAGRRGGGLWLVLFRKWGVGGVENNTLPSAPPHLPVNVGTLSHSINYFVNNGRINLCIQKLLTKLLIIMDRLSGAIHTLCHHVKSRKPCHIRQLRRHGCSEVD